MDFTQMSEVEIAVIILRENGRMPMNYKELIREVIKRKQREVQSEAEAIAEIYTHINVDSRFHYEGHGEWGLAEWIPQAKAHSGRAHAGLEKA